MQHANNMICGWFACNDLPMIFLAIKLGGAWLIEGVYVGWGVFLPLGGGG
jgi:hypothetical protein